MDLRPHPAATPRACVRLGHPGRACGRLPHAQAWKEKGQGLLTVRQPAGGGPSAVVFTTEAGRVLVNAALYKGVKVVLQVGTRTPALHVNLWCVRRARAGCQAACELLLVLEARLHVDPWCGVRTRAGRQAASELRFEVEAPLLARPMSGACGPVWPALRFKTGQHRLLSPKANALLTAMVPLPAAAAEANTLSRQLRKQAW
jgi:hypothetical protein